MGTSRWVFAALTLPLLGCGESSQTWTRIVHTQNDGGHQYSIIQADPVTDTCVRVELRTPYEWEEMPTQDGEVEVEIVGLDGLIFDQARGERPIPEFPDQVISRDCTTIEAPNDVGPPAPRLSGKIEFSELASAADPSGPCRVDFELSIRSVVYELNDLDELEMSEDLYEISGHDLAIFAEGCPHPDNFEAHYTELDAAYAELNGLGTVVISSWDELDEVCVWARLLSSANGLPSPSAVEVPGSWAYSGLRVASTGREACVASELLDPNGVDADDSTSADPLGSTGSVRFGPTMNGETAAGSVTVPCSIDVDLELRGYGEYYWSPERVQMQATSVAVAGACG